MPAFSPTVLLTERLKLRWLDERDAQAQFAIYSNPEVMRYGSGAPWTELAQAEANIARALDGYRSGSAQAFAIELVATGELVGNCTLFGFDETNRRAEIGYSLARHQWGRGYVREALTALIGHGFDVLGLNRLEADTDPRNAASIKALEALKFQKEGFLRERWLVNGEVCDTAFYGLLRSDWVPGTGTSDLAPRARSTQPSI